MSKWACGAHCHRASHSINIPKYYIVYLLKHFHRFAITWNTICEFIVAMCAGDSAIIARKSRQYVKLIKMSYMVRFGWSRSVAAVRALCLAFSDRHQFSVWSGSLDKNGIGDFDPHNLDALTVYSVSATSKPTDTIHKRFLPDQMTHTPYHIVYIIHPTVPLSHIYKHDYHFRKHSKCSTTDCKCSMLSALCVCMLGTSITSDDHLNLCC